MDGLDLSPTWDEARDDEQVAWRRSKRKRVTARAQIVAGRWPQQSGGVEVSPGWGETPDRENVYDLKRSTQVIKIPNKSLIASGCLYYSYQP